MAHTRAQRTQGKLVTSAQSDSQETQTTSQLTRPPSTSSLCLHEAKPTTPPQSAGVLGSYQCIVDYNNHPFSITWSGSPSYPDLTSFPSIKNLEISPVHQSLEMAIIWRDSKLLDYGSHASIRSTKHGDRFPILKLAHEDEVSIKLIQYEFAILAELTKLGLPIVEFDQQPILDNGITYGYQMERLTKLEADELSFRADDVKKAFDRFHCAGFSHGDVGPSNIMTKDGCITLIDPSFAGRVGSAVPDFFPSWVYIDGRFGIGSDLERFGRYWDGGIITLADRE